MGQPVQCGAGEALTPQNFGPTLKRQIGGIEESCAIHFHQDVAERVHFDEGRTGLYGWCFNLYTTTKEVEDFISEVVGDRLPAVPVTFGNTNVPGGRHASFHGFASEIVWVAVPLIAEALAQDSRPEIDLDAEQILSVAQLIRRERTIISGRICRTECALSTGQQESGSFETPTSLTHSDTSSKKRKKSRHSWNAESQAAADEYKRRWDKESERTSMEEFCKRYAIDKDLRIRPSTLARKLSTNRNKWDPDGKYRLK